MSSTLVEVGRYRGKVVDHDIGKSSKGTPQVAVQFEFTDKRNEVRKITWYGYFTTATMSSEHGVIKQLGELGFDVEKEGWKLGKLGKRSAANPDGGVLVGREADITIEKDEYDGKETRKVAWINSDGGMGMKVRAETPEDIANFIKEVRANASGTVSEKPAARSEAAKPSGGKGAAAPAETAKKGDDLPF
jgi:hypothetical protein